MNPGDDDLSEKDWFAEAMDYATSSPEANRAKAAAERLEIRIREAQRKAIRSSGIPYAPTRLPVDSAKVADAIKAFGIAASPSRSAERWKALEADGGFAGPSNAREIKAKPPTPEEGLKAILDAVRQSPDPFKSAGEWITKITFALAEIASESDEDSGN